MNAAEAALSYAARGWPVFPCRAGQKIPATMHGVLDATTDPEQIRNWWNMWPDANVAIATGDPGPDAIDVDVKPDGTGWVAFTALKAAGLIDGASQYVSTPSGGLHAYYTGTAQRNGTIRGKHIDFRGKGGYVVAPPSAVDGKPYKPLKTSTPGTATADWRAIRALLEPPPEFTQPPHAASNGQERPGDLWAAQATWPEILKPHGWRKVRDLGNGHACWCRPGKDGPFTSATTREDGGLYVFSTSTQFDPEKPYTKFGAYALLEHGGDHVLAAQALRAEGYGSPAPATAFTQPASSSPDTLFARLLHGGVILDVPAVPDAVWGDGEEILWAAGQSLVVAGPDGVGKTTLAGNLIKARIGLGPGHVLGLPVKPGDRCVLVLLMDRPQQAMAALARLFTEHDRDALNTRLRIWRGPPPQDLARNTELLAELCALAGADTCLVDSLKDAALKLTDDETGSGWNRARQIAIEAGTELVELHHPRKGQDGNRRPSKLDDLYGSRWISAGAGSVISLWGQAGDPIVEFSHLKPPVETLGPWRIEINNATGHVERSHIIDLVDQIRQRGSHGLTAQQAATLLYGNDKPTRNDIAKATRALAKRETQGLLVRQDHGTGRGHEAVWLPAAAPQFSVTFSQSHETSHAEVTPRSESHAALEEPVKSRAQAPPYIRGPVRDFWPPGSIGEEAAP